MESIGSMSTEAAAQAQQCSVIFAQVGIISPVISVATLRESSEDLTMWHRVRGISTCASSTQRRSRPSSTSLQCSRSHGISLQKCSSDAAKGVAVYNSHLLQQLFSILGLKFRQAKTLAEVLLHNLGERIVGSAVDGFEGSSCQARPDGTTAVSVQRLVPHHIQ